MSGGNDGIDTNMCFEMNGPEMIKIIIKLLCVYSHILRRVKKGREAV